MAFTDAQVAEWFKNNPGASETQIAQAMQVSGVDPSQVARVTGADPGYVAEQYRAVTTAGPPSPSAPVQAAPAPTLVNAPVAPAPSTEAASPQARNATVQVPTERFTDEQVMEWIQSNPRATEAQIADAMRTSGVSPAQVARVINAPVELVTQRFAQYTAPAPTQAPTQAPVDQGIAAAAPPSFNEQLNTLFNQNLGRAPTEREASIDANVPPPTPRQMYRAQYTPFRQPGQASFGGYYGMPGVNPYGGVFGFGTEQFNQQTNPFAASRMAAQNALMSRAQTPYGFRPNTQFGTLGFQMTPPGYSGYNPFSGGANMYGMRPSAFGGQMSPMGMQSNPFTVAQQTPTPTTAPTRAGARPGQSVFQGAKTAMRRGGSVDLGIRAVKLKR
jgi:uncharacterized protein YneF (UPF0154 family)